jgi:protocatechuate 3,4-dioxygenase beta subunit
VGSAGSRCGARCPAGEIRTKYCGIRTTEVDQAQARTADLAKRNAGTRIESVPLQLLDEACAPVVGASVDVWHVSAVGEYSGNDATNENVAFCTGSDSDFTSHLYFRGKQTTDATGVVFFDTCYPGWYSGRTVHIHLTARIGDQSYLTTQLFFDDALNDDILTSQSLYASRGARNTTKQNDSVVVASAVGGYTFQTQKMTDGALLAWKTLVMRSSLASASCAIPGGAAPTGT